MVHVKIHIIVCLLVASVVLSACEVIFLTANDLAEQQKKKPDWKKGTLILGGTALALLGGWGLVKHLDILFGRGLLEKAEKAALKSRQTASMFYQGTFDNPPLYKLTAPDGSEHWLLGTMHTTGISLDDFPQDSKIFAALHETTVLMPERDVERLFKDSHDELLKYIKNKIFTSKASSKPDTGFDLRKALGDEYMEKLLKEFGDGNDKNMLAMGIEKFSNAQVLNLLNGAAVNLAFGKEGVMMDAQLIRKFRQGSGKKVIGLESGKDITAALKNAPEDDVSIDNLKKFIDDGGILNRAKQYLQARDAYGRGDVAAAGKILDGYSSDLASNKVMIGGRNLAWVKSQTIQKNCRAGRKCMVAVGFGHLFEGDNSLSKLLTAEGFKIEKI